MEEADDRTKQRSRSRTRRRSKSLSSSVSSCSTRSAEGEHFKWNPGMMLDSKYEVLKLLGDGTFGRVLLAKNTHISQEVAIKVIRDVQRYTESAMIEAEILSAIYKADSKGDCKCSIMYGAFMHEMTYFCMVLEPLGASLYDVLKANDYRGFWMQDMQVFSHDLMQALSFLHGQLRITHTDLKVENILLESMEPVRPAHFPREVEWLKTQPPSSDEKLGPYMRPAAGRVKLIDFGNATREDEHHSTTINTRQYRGPEILLQIEWDMQSDIWSLGCILMELYTGDLLFQSRGDLEHLAVISHVIESIPQHMLNGASQSVKRACLTNSRGTPANWQVAWPEKSGLSESSERRACKDVSSRKSLSDMVLPHHKAFGEFVAALLRLEPGQRLRAINALLHPFLEAKFED